MKTWDTFELHLENRGSRDSSRASGDLIYRRWIVNFLNLTGGASYFQELEKDKSRLIIGIGYILPMLVEIDLMVDQLGKVRLDLKKKLQWTKYLLSEIDLSLRQDRSPESQMSLLYASAWSCVLSGLDRHKNWDNLSQKTVRI